MQHVKSSLNDLSSTLNDIINSFEITCNSSNKFATLDLKLKNSFQLAKRSSSQKRAAPKIMFLILQLATRRLWRGVLLIQHQSNFRLSHTDSMNRCTLKKSLKKFPNIYPLATIFPIFRECQYLRKICEIL